MEQFVKIIIESTHFIFKWIEGNPDYIENNDLMITGEFLNKPEFKQFSQLKISSDEAYAANSVWINNKVLIPEGFPKTIALVESAGYGTLAVDTSEFRKLDGGLSCLSLRF